MEVFGFGLSCSDLANLGSYFDLIDLGLNENELRTLWFLVRRRRSGGWWRKGGRRR